MHVYTSQPVHTQILINYANRDLIIYFSHKKKILQIFII